MATADEAAIWELLVQILQEPPGTSVDLLARLVEAFPGREAIIASVINKFLLSGRFDVHFLHNKLYESALTRILDAAVTNPGSIVVAALPEALRCAVLDFLEANSINMKVDRDRLLNQLAFCVNRRSPEFQSLYAAAKARVNVPRVITNATPTTFINKARGHVFGGGIVNSISADGGAVGGGGHQDNHDGADAGQRRDGEGKQEEKDAVQECLRLLRGLDLKVDSGLKRNSEETEDIRKRLRTVEDHNLAMGMELSNLRGNMSNFQQQLTAVTSVINTALGAMAGPRMMTGGGGGALGGLLGFGGGGGHVRPPSTSLLRHTPRTRPNLPRTAAPPRPSSVVVDLSLDEDDDEEEDKVSAESTGAEESKGNEG